MASFWAESAFPNCRSARLSRGCTPSSFFLFGGGGVFAWICSAWGVGFPLDLFCMDPLTELKCSPTVSAIQSPFFMGSTYFNFILFEIRNQSPAMGQCGKRAGLGHLSVMLSTPPGSPSHYQLWVSSKAYFTSHFPLVSPLYPNLGLVSHWIHGNPRNLILI